MPTSKLIYLDSSDFSDFSKPDIAPNDAIILRDLRRHREVGTVKFYMSAIHVVEAVHAAEKHKPAAILRAEIIKELCGSNILVFPTEIVRLEINNALSGKSDYRLSPDQLVSKGGQWFGLASDIDTIRASREEAKEAIKEQISKLPRRERRKLQSDLDFGKKRSHARWRDLIKANSPQILAECPYSFISSEEAISWFLGETSDEEYHDKLIKIMSDPVAMFKYFLDAANHRSNLYELLRRIGYSIAKDLDVRTKALLPFLALIARGDVAINLNTEMKHVSSRPELMRRTIDVFAETNVKHLSDVEIKRIAERSPSLAVFREASKEYLLSTARTYCENQEWEFIGEISKA